MKNAVLLLLAAGLLFGVSAGLSLWLNRPKATDEVAAAPKPSTAKNPTAPKHPEEKHEPIPERPATTPPSSTDPLEISIWAKQVQAERARLTEREAEMDQQREVYRVVLDDIRDEMLVLQRLWQQRAAAAKAAGSRPPEPFKPGPTTAPPMMPPPIGLTVDPKKPNVGDGRDPKSVGLASKWTESMPPENAAKLVEQMNKAGDLDLIVQLLSKMNQRQVAKILAAIGDEKLVMQLVKKLADAPRPLVVPAVGGPP